MAELGAYIWNRSKGERLNTHEIIGGVVIFLFGAVTTLLSIRMPIGTFRKSGTGLFPLCLGILLMVLSGLFLLQRFLKRQTTDKKIPITETPGSTAQMIFFFAVMVFATLFLNRLGYPLTSFLLLLALLKILGMKRWSLNILLSLGTSAVCYLLFVQWLKIPLPKGWIGI
jgi:putative tricarboxylic transport membrane protein